MRYTKVQGANNNHVVNVYSLTTCPNCANAKKYLKERDIAFEFIDVDTATRDEKREITLFLKQNNLPISFPVITIDDKIMTGFNKEEIDILLNE